MIAGSRSHGGHAEQNLFHLAEYDASGLDHGASLPSVGPKIVTPDVLLASNKSAGSGSVSETAFRHDVMIGRIPPRKPEPDTGLREWLESSVLPQYSLQANKT